MGLSNFLSFGVGTYSRGSLIEVLQHRAVFRSTMIADVLLNLKLSSNDFSSCVKVLAFLVSRNIPEVLDLTYLVT